MKTLAVDADFPGGNIVVDRTSGDTVALHQDPRDTPIWWFYWCFRIRNAAGRKVRFRFINGDVFGGAGPCMSAGAGRWRWLGRHVVEDSGFAFAFPPTLDSARFSFCVPYVETDLMKFLAAHRRIERSTLVRSEGGRSVEHLWLRSRRSRFKVLLTARHHACEGMASYVLEGVLSFWAGRSPEAAFLRENVDFHAIPFMDKDGVETGDQGKARAPHDHNRDYSDSPIYASTRALMARFGEWPGDPLLMADLHCPWIRGGMNDDIHIVEPQRVDKPAMQAFLAALVKGQRGPLLYYPKNYLAFGVDWNVDTATSAAFFTEATGVRLAFTLEFPYAVAAENPVTVTGARAFGADLSRAIAVFLCM